MSSRFYRVSQSRWTGLWYVEVRLRGEYGWNTADGKKYATEEEALEAMKKLEAENVAV